MAGELDIVRQALELDDVMYEKIVDSSVEWEGKDLLG